MSDVVIVDSGGANIASLNCALKRLGCEATLSRDPDVIAGARRVILPGVGAAADAMQRLQALALTDVLSALTQPVLGITDERAELIPSSPTRSVPHMGWNEVVNVADSPLMAGIGDGSYFYFVHSYALPVSASTVASCDYGAPFSAVMQHGNFFGTQFHPERSAKAGAQLLANFLDL